MNPFNLLLGRLRRPPDRPPTYTVRMYRRREPSVVVFRGPCLFASVAVATVYADYYGEPTVVEGDLGEDIEFFVPNAPEVAL